MRSPARVRVPVPGARVDDQLRGRGLDRVGALQLGVADEFAAVDGEQQMRDALPCRPAQLQPALLGHGLLTVVPGGLGEQGEDGLGLLRGEFGKGVDRAGAAGPHGVVAGHAYEGKGRARQSGGGRRSRTDRGAHRDMRQDLHQDVHQAVTGNPLSRYAR